MFEKYRIKKNDTIETIAGKFKTSPDYIIDINNIDNDIREGMDIIVPSNSKKYFEYYTINKGDTLYAIGRKYNINPTLLAALNGLNIEDYIYQGQIIMIPLPNYSYYITKDGDTLESINKVFESNPDKLLLENETIYLLPGQIMVSKRNR